MMKSAISFLLSLGCLEVALGTVVFQQNVVYASNPNNTMDIYLPSNITDETKLMLLIHGDGWNMGEKASMTHAAVSYWNLLKGQHGVANMNFRLGSKKAPGYPIQLEDIDAALVYLKDKVFKRDVNVALVGLSTGGHLAMLYGFRNGSSKGVKVIINIVGIADVEHEDFAYNAHLNIMYSFFVGPYVPCQKPELWKETNPVTYIKSDSPPTQAFFGKNDTFTPISQAKRLKDKLDESGVQNEIVTYPGWHFWGWKQTEMDDLTLKSLKFLKKHW